MPRKTPFEYAQDIAAQYEHVEQCFDALDESAAYLDGLLDKSMYDLAKKYSNGFYNEVFARLKTELEELESMINNFSVDMDDL